MSVVKKKVTRSDRSIVADAIRELETRERLILVLYYYHRMSFKEIGAALKLSGRRVRTLHSGVLKRIHLRMPRLPRLVRNEDHLSVLLCQQDVLSKRLAAVEGKIASLKIPRLGSSTLKQKLGSLDRAKLIDADAFAAQIAGGRIAAARKARRWTQQQLAGAAGMPQSQIARLERNPEKCNITTLKRVASALHVDVSALLGPTGGE